MKNIILLMIFVGGALHSLSAREVSVNYLSILLAESDELTSENLPPSAEGYALDEVVASLRKLDDKSPGRHTSALIRLRDVATISKYIDAYTAEGGMASQAYRALLSSRSPWVIPHVMPLFMDAPPAQLVTLGGSVNFGPAGDTHALVLYLLSTSPEIPTSVQQWAKVKLGSTRQIDKMNASIQELRAWWRLNAKHFDSERYDLVAPFESTDKPLENLQLVPPTPEPPAPVALPTDPTSEPVKSSVAASMPTPAAEPEPAAKPNSLWWIIGLIILATGAVFMTRKHQPKD